MENEISILLKRARELGIPAKYVHQNENLISKITNLIPTGITLAKLYEEYPFPDLVMLYAYLKQNAVSKAVLLNEINEFYKTKFNLSKDDQNKIKDVQELNLLIEEFKISIQDDFQKDMKQLNKIENVQDQLADYIGLNYTAMDVESVILFSSMKYEERLPVITDEYDIFDQIKPDITVPFIKWNANYFQNKEIFKIYKGKTLEERPKFDKIVYGGDTKERINTFSFSVWDGDLEKDNIKDASRESYLKGSYNLKTNLMRIKIPIDKGKDKILSRITTAFPLEFDQITETAISGELFMFDIEINDLILSHMIMNFELLNTFLFMKEMSSSFAEKKKQMKIYFRSLSSVSEDNIPASVAFSINQMYSKGGENITLANGKNIKLNSNEPYIRIKISSADSIKAVEDFMAIFSRLLSYYKGEKNDVEALYKEFIPNYNEVSVNQLAVASRKIGKEMDTKIARLKQAAPDLFITDYARKCLCPFQPIVIPNDEIKAWENKTFLVNNKAVKRQVMRFPPENPKWNFVCPEDTYPFPGVKKNNLENNKTYLGLPCCFAKDQLGKTAKSKYNKLYGEAEEEEEEEVEEEVKEVKFVEGHIVKTDKILEPGRYGTLPVSIVNLLQNDETEIRRKGVIRSENSLLHAISMAINDKKYLRKDTIGREEYVAQLRLAIADETHSGLVRQQLYDFTDEEIEISLREGFLDPNYYYRAIEEAYDINLFVFAPSNDEEKRLKNKEESTGVICLPRFKLFYARTPRPQRANICIYRTMGSERDDLKYPQCELIVAHSDGEDVGVFSEDMWKTLWQSLQMSFQTISWELVSGKGGKIDTIARDNVFSRLNFQEIFPNATKQYIDQYGKMRGLYLKHSANNINSSNSEEEMMVIFPSSEPINLPSHKKIIRAKEQTVLKYFSNPTAASVTNGMKDGLWFSILDLVYGIYVPIQETPNTNLPVGPSNPLGEKGKEVVPRIRKLKRDLSFITQIIKWLFALYLKSVDDRRNTISNENNSVALNDFMFEYIGIGEETEEDSARIYDFTNVGRVFPVVDTVEEGIKEMSLRVPSLFSDGRLYLYSEKFYNGLFYLMQMFVKEYLRTLDLVVPTTITRDSLTEEDFRSFPETALFLTDYDFKNWLNSLEKYPEIYKTINTTFAYKTEPFMYMALDKHIYLVQNVVKGEFSKALNVCYYWDKHKVNPGYNIPEFSEDYEPKYVVYGISAANALVPIKNTAGESLNFYSIIQYNSTTYGAMLLLL